jgi:tetratricopeptide (TPR) repeat protein
MLLKMKFDLFKIGLCFVMMLGLPALSFGDDGTQALFEKANNYYSKNKYKEAVSTYNQLLKSGESSAIVYYNLGNAFYKDGDIASALLYYEKAHKLSPGDEDINFNIRFANARTTDKIDEAPELFLSKWWRGVILAVSADTLGIVAIVLFLFGSGLLVFYFFSVSGSIKKFSFFSGLALFFLGIVSIIIGGSQVGYFNSNKQAIVFTSSVSVKGSPADKANTVFVIHDGTKVNVLDNANGWLRIKLANGNEGWLKPSDVKEI